MNIVDLIPKCEIKPGSMCLCAFCQEKFFPNECEIIIRESDRNLVFRCNDCKETCDRCGAEGTRSMVGDESFSMCEVCRDDMGVTR